MANTTITSDDVVKIAKLANLPVSEEEKQLFAAQFSTIIDVIKGLNEIDTKNISLTSQVTHLENVTRPDAIDQSRVLTQAQALSDARQTHQGFFVVSQILEKDSE